MLPLFWSQVLQFSNCKIISKEGKQKFTHKILLASKSEFMKTILVEIPEGSEVVIILPDFSLNDVEILLEKLMNDESIIQSNLWEMLVESKELKPYDFQDMNNANVEKHEVADTFVQMDDKPAEIDTNSDKHFKNTYQKET